MDKRHLNLGSTFAALAVIIGAFGAHALEATLIANDKIATYDTAVQYHMFHALAILIVGLLMKHQPHQLLKLVSYLFVAGITVFSGSLYVLSITNYSILGAITPLGGVAFIAGWILLIAYLIKH
ncbi:DUF423 domain-containing protein [Marinoscillum furvescens]|uniref:Uncharacterized membrane protein YgdD (TMEM256/DUF423 family) n=1 Tax=Marinoscillum furvescens DSM 4134 TaxID=1122208 RepID=A0A3D9L1P2_MARFU|nr:DUF423 domain-containing protein [Marinoscillum furvescens]RED97509.1 uncharacterized membrane protein YgdD (TMEM256/DUF423 family) [Marinoscillum furvescens DSM 4134]